MGFNGRTGDATLSPCDDVISFLESQLGDGWELFLFTMSSLRVGLPQHRDRLYLCGRRKECFEEHLKFSPPHLFFSDGLSLRDILDKDVPCTYSKLSAQMRSNLEYYKKEAQKHCDPGEICAADLTRASAMLRPTLCRHDSFLPTLTSRNRYLWMFEVVSPYLVDPSPIVDRFLTSAERCRAQGFSDEIMQRLPETKVVEATGNAMSLPAVAVVIACLLQGRISIV